MAKKSGSLEVQVLQDPYKTKVSSPLSTWLSSEVGKGLPQYSGQLYEPFDATAYNTYKQFLAINPEEWYKNAVEAPTMETVREQIPLIDEGWAGSLRGSGRFRDREDYLSDVGDTLAQGRYQALLDIPKQQFEMASAYKTMKDTDYAKEYTDWFASLPQNNPALNASLQFLQGSTGIDFATYYDQGEQKKNWGSSIGTILGIGAAGLLSMALPGAGILGMGVMNSLLAGGAVGGMTGGLFDK